MKQLTLLMDIWSASQYWLHTYIIQSRGSCSHYHLLYVEVYQTFRYRWKPNASYDMSVFRGASKAFFPLDAANIGRICESTFFCELFFSFSTEIWSVLRGKDRYMGWIVQAMGRPFPPFRSHPPSSYSKAFGWRPVWWGSDIWRWW